MGGNSGVATEGVQGTAKGLWGGGGLLAVGKRGWGWRLGCGNAFGVESGPESWEGGGYPPPPLPSSKHRRKQRDSRLATNPGA